MVDPFSTIQTVLGLFGKVLDLIATFSANQEDCRRIRKHMEAVKAVVEPLKQGQSNILASKEVRAQLKLLEEVLESSLETIQACQKKCAIKGCIKAKSAARILLQVDTDISKQVNLLQLTISIKIASTITVTAEKQADLHISDVHLQQQVEKSVQTHRSSTEHASRPVVKNEKDNVPAADIKTPCASLSSDGSVMFISSKTSIGQDSPCIVDKDSSHRSNPGNGAGSGKNENKRKKICGPNTVGSKVETEKTNVPADSNGSRALLSYAQSTSVKSVDGQGHPRIVTKMISSSIENMIGVISIDMHPTKPWIVTGDMGGNVCVWDYKKQITVMKKLVTKKPSSFANIMHELSQYHKEKAGKHWVCSATFITEKNWLVVGDGKGYIYIYNYNNTELPVIKEFKAHDDGNSVDLAVHPTKTYLLSSSAYGNKIILWDWSSYNWKKIHKFDVKSAYPYGVLSLKFNPRDSNTFACVTDDKRLMVGNIETYSFTTIWEGISKADYFFNHTDQDLMVTLSSSSNSHNAEIRDIETGKLVDHLDASGRRMRLVTGHPTLPILVTTLNDGTVCFWDANAYKRLEKEVRITDEHANDLTLFTDVNGITRLAVASKSTLAIMEVSYSPGAITSGPTGGGKNKDG